MLCLSAVDYCENGLGFLVSQQLGQKVSLITVTQFARYECLQTLYDLIQLQTYNHILEWVIVEGSRNPEDGLKNKMNIQK